MIRFSDATRRWLGGSSLFVAAALLVGDVGSAAMLGGPMPDYRPAPAARPRTGISLPLGKCVNMGSMLDKPVEGSFGQAPLRDSDLANIKAAGFGTIRLPLTTHAATSAPYAIDLAYLKRVRHVVDTAVANGLNVIVDLHRFDALSADPEGQTAAFVAIWRQLGGLLADEPASHVWFELLNEPKGKFNATNFVPIMSKALAAVRERNPTRPVVIGDYNSSHIPSLKTFTMPADPYVVPTFHNYDPIPFTHQGSPYMAVTPPFGRGFGAAGDAAEIDGDLAQVKAYMARTGRVPFLGEFGAIDYAPIPPAERTRYLGAVSAAYASIGVQSCVWSYANTYRIWDGQHWLPGVLQALRTTTTRQ
jgi:endoglucanase